MNTERQGSRNPTAFLQYLREQDESVPYLGRVGVEGDIRLSHGYQLKRSQELHREFVEKALNAILKPGPIRLIQEKPNQTKTLDKKIESKIDNS